MIVLNESNFKTETNSGTVLVDFYADWCGPCRLLTPVVEKIENTKLFKVDIDQSPDLATDYQISSIPTLVFLKDGVEVDRIIGMASRDKIQGKINTING